MGVKEFWKNRSFWQKIFIKILLIFGVFYSIFYLSVLIDSRLVVLALPFYLIIAFFMVFIEYILIFGFLCFLVLLFFKVGKGLITKQSMNLKAFFKIVVAIMIVVILTILFSGVMCQSSNDMCKGRPDGARCDTGVWCDAFGRVCGGQSCVGHGLSTCFQGECGRDYPTPVVACAEHVAFDIRNICKFQDDYRIFVSNDANRDIVSWKIRLYQTTEKVESIDSNEGIKALNVGYITIKPKTVTEIRKVEILPLIQIDSIGFTCLQNIDTYGDVEGEPITEECNK